MKPENKKFLDDNYGTWITLRDAQFIRGLNGHERSEMQRIMSEEFQPGYTADLWCPSCVADMVKLLYTRYEKWKEENVEPPVQSQTTVLESEPLKVKASFPNNKNSNNGNKKSTRKKGIDREINNEQSESGKTEGEQ